MSLHTAASGKWSQSSASSASIPSLLDLMVLESVECSFVDPGLLEDNIAF
jgi:hypothetical protein